MATVQLHLGLQGSYESPYSFVSTYDKWPIRDQGGSKDTRSNEPPTHNPTSSHYLAGREQTINDVANDPDDGLLNIDELISDMMQQKEITTSGITGNTDVGVGSGGSAVCPMKGSTQDLLATSVEFEVGHSVLEVDLTAVRESDPQCDAASSPADSDSLGSGTTLTSKLSVGNDKDNEIDSGIVSSATIQLVEDLPTSISPSHGSFARQAIPIQVNTEITPWSASYIDLGVIKEAEDGSVNTRSTERSDSPAVAAPSHQPNLSSEVLSGHRHQRNNTIHVCRKRQRTRTPSTPIQPSGTASHVSDALGSNTFKRTPPTTRSASSAKEPEIRNIDQGIADDRGSSDSDDEGYCEISHTPPSKVRGGPRSRKRARRARGAECNGTEPPSTLALNVSYQAIAATSSNGMHESEEISVLGSLTLKTVGSRVVYCLTFSQEVLRESGGTSQRKPRSVSSSSDRRDSDQLSVREGTVSGSVKKSQFSTKEDNFLRQLKEEGFSWDEIKDRFSDRLREGSKGFHERSKGTLQVHYSTKLKPHSETSNNEKKRRRSGLKATST